MALAGGQWCVGVGRHERKDWGAAVSVSHLVRPISVFKSKPLPIHLGAGSRERGASAGGGEWQVGMRHWSQWGGRWVVRHQRGQGNSRAFTRLRAHNTDDGELHRGVVPLRASRPRWNGDLNACSPVAQMQHCGRVCSGYVREQRCRGSGGLRRYDLAGISAYLSQ